MNTSLIEKKLEKYKSISFDIFDTLLKRDVFKPTDVFQIVQDQYDRWNHTNSDFKTLRIEAERRAREKSIYPEVTFDEIYDELKISDKDNFKKLELEIESRVLHCNYPFKKIYDACVASGKDIYIISDMYLPTSFLESVLKREGYSDYKALVVSAEYRKTKKSGKLYKILMETQSVNSNELIHIGDSRYADYIGARKCGIRAIHIPRVDVNTIYLKVPDKNISFVSRSLFAFINSRIQRYPSREERLGYEVLGPILYAYSKWIHDRFERYKQEIDSNAVLWFAARDMYLFKQAYEIIYGSGPDARYVYISRKSLRPVLTSTTGDITESGKIFARGQYTIQEIVRKMGYSADDLADGIVDDGKKYDGRTLSAYPEVRKALSSPKILENEKKLAEVGIEYLKENGLFDTSVVIVDVGWHGTTQYLLRKIQESVLGTDRLYGLYLGCLDSTNERIGKENYSAFAFDEDHNSEFSKGILLFESLILAPHGSTIKYIRKSGKITPVLGEPDNISEILLNIQKGAVDFIKDFRHSCLEENIELNAEVVTEAFCTLALSPEREELDTIGNFDYDDFGIEKLASPKPLWMYITHPKQLYHDLKYSPWRVGFLYKLFKVKLPYGKIYSILRRLDKNKMT